MDDSKNDALPRQWLPRLSTWLGSARRAWVVALCLALLQGSLLVRQAWDKSDMGIEGIYLTNAAVLWNHGRITRSWHALTPLWGFALTTRLADPEFAKGASTHDEVNSVNDRVGVPEQMEQMLWRKPYNEMRFTLVMARLATILATVLAGLFLWRAAWRFGALAALVTHLLWVLSPTVLANGYQAMLDAWTAATACVVIWAAVRLYESPRAGSAAVLGAAAALAIPTKATSMAAVGFSLLFCIGVGALQTATDSRRKRALATLRLVGAYAAAAFFVLWALLAFRLERWHGIPYPPLDFYARGFLAQAERGGGGENYLFGEVHYSSVWWFYLACLALKMTVGGQGLLLLKGWAVWRKRAQWRTLALDAVLLAVPLVVFVAMSLGTHQPNVNYLLPAMPFAMLWAGRAWQHVGDSFGLKGQYAALALLALGGVESLRVHPDHQMFFNLWAGGPERGPHYLIVRDDFGQDRRALGEWQQKNGVPLIFYTRVDLPGTREAAWGIRAKPVPCQPTPGVYALQALITHAPDQFFAGCADWLTVEPPDERLGSSIYIYRVDEARIERLKQKRAEGDVFWSSAHIRDRLPAYLYLSAKREGDQVRVKWRGNKRVLFTAVRTLDDPENELGVVAQQVGSDGSVLVPPNKSGRYGVVAFPGFVVATANVDGPEFHALSSIAEGTETPIFWNVPEGPVVIKDEAGNIIAQSQEALGVSADAPERTTTYTLTYGQGTTLTTRVEVVP